MRPLAVQLPHPAGGVASEEIPLPALLSRGSHNNLLSTISFSILTCVQLASLAHRDPRGAHHKQGGNNLVAQTLCVCYSLSVTIVTTDGETVSVCKPELFHGLVDCTGQLVLHKALQSRAAF